MIILDSYSTQQTQEIAKKLGSLMLSGSFICLNGDLGAGKTAFTSGLAKGMGIEEHIVSPTYTIVHEYDGPLPLYHFDVYRIEDVEEMYDLGYEEYFYGGGVTVVEWATLIEEILPKNNLSIDLKVGDEPNHRKIYITANGQGYDSIVKEMTRDEDISN